MYRSVCSAIVPAVEVAVRYRTIDEDDFNDWHMLSYFTTGSNQSLIFNHFYPRPWA